MGTKTKRRTERNRQKTVTPTGGKEESKYAQKKARQNKGDYSEGSPFFGR
jgi:hypothetical protein